LKLCTGLDWPSLKATASSDSEAPAGSEPAQPAGSLACGFQVIVSTCGTPSVNRTFFAGGALHATESHTTWPCCVATSWTEPAP
jgi:hypothetical protein